MRLLEYEGKELLKKAGISIPGGEIATTSKEARQMAGNIDGPVVLKAQIPKGGRKKAGGILFASSKLEAEEKTSQLLGKVIKGVQVKEVLVEERIAIDQELYLGFIVDSSTGKIGAMFSKHGGVNIEEIAESRPSQVHRMDIESLKDFREYKARNLIRRSGIQGKMMVKLAKMVTSFYKCFKRYEMVMGEINPLAVSAHNRLIALDAVVEIDDNSLFRSQVFDQGRLRQNLTDEVERKAYDLGINSFVKLDGEVGIVASGAGLGMATMDILHSFGLSPANFLETGGGITEELVKGAIGIVSRQKKVRGIIVNLYGGINPMVDAANGVVKAIKEGVSDIPIVVKLLGNREQEAWDILEQEDIPVIKTVHTEQAVEELKNRIKNNKKT